MNDQAEVTTKEEPTPAKEKKPARVVYKPNRHDRRKAAVLARREKRK